MTTSVFDDRYVEDFVTVNGLRLHYTDWGGRDAPPIVLVHGLNVQLHTWDPIAALLADEFRVLCLDLRGHGESDWAKEGYPVSAFVSDIRGFAEELGIVPFDFVGHSLGARIGIAYGGEHSDTLRHLLLSDTGPEVPRDAALKVRALIGSTSELRGFRTEEDAKAHFEQAHPEWQPVFHDLHVRYQLRKNWAGKLVFKSDPELFWLNGSASAREIPYLWEAAAKISVPTLIMWGTKSELLTEEIVERMQATMQDAHVARFETGHYIPREQPEEFARIVREFLGGGPAGASA